MALARSTRLTTTVAAGVTVLLLAAGCSSESDDPAEKSLGLDQESSSAPAASPEPSESEEPGDSEEIQTSFPDIGLEFTKFPKDPKPREVEPLSVYVDFERGQSMMVRTAKFNDLLTDNAQETALSEQRSTVQYLQENNGRFRGDDNFDVEVEESNKRIMLLAVCEDGSKLRLTLDGDPEPIQGPTRVPISVTLNAFADGWRVVDYTRQEGAC